MTDVEKKALEAYPIHPSPVEAQITIKKGEDTHIDLRKGYTQALIEYESLPKIHGWVARDMGPLNALDLNIGKLKLWPKAPIRNNVGCFWMPDFPQDAAIMDLPKETMPELAWKSEPVEVELLIREI